MRPIQRFLSGGPNEAGPAPFQQAMMRALRDHGEITVESMRALSPFEENAQRIIDQAVVSVGVNRLVIAADLFRLGLTFPLANPLSVMEVQWEKISKTGGAQRTMTPSARGERQLPKRTPQRVPVYLTTDDFSIDIRSFQMSQRIGTPIDTTLVEQATRRVNEAIEDSVINGGVTVDGYSTPGILTAPNVNVKTMTANWNTATGDQIFGDVESWIGTLQGDNKFGPYGLYTGTTIGNALDKDFKANGQLTIRQRLLMIENLVSIKTADQLPVNTVVLLQLSKDVIDMIDGQAPTVIPWTSVDGFTLFWMVMAIQVPRVRDDYDGNSGIVIATP
jgi:uncharacterized linocin/CFP29 family protein